MKLRTLLAAVLACALGTLLHPASAAAANPANITRSRIFLAHYPESSASAFLLTPSRRIWLAQGTYHWVNAFYGTLPNPAPGERDIYLAQGWYAWNCYILAQTVYLYSSSCSLTPESGGAIAYTPLMSLDADTSATYGGVDGEWFTWTSTLEME